MWNITLPLGFNGSGIGKSMRKACGRKEEACRGYPERNHFGHGGSLGDGAVFPVPATLGLEEVTNLTGIFSGECSLDRVLETMSGCPVRDHRKPRHGLPNHKVPLNYNYSSE